MPIPSPLSVVNPTSDGFVFASGDICHPNISLYSIVLSLVYLALFLLSVIGNIFVIITILGKRHLANRSITNFYLLNLAIADLLRSLVCIPSTLVSEIYRCWMFGAVMCKLSAFLQPVGVCASAYTLVVIAVERYYAICKPLHSRNWHTKKRSIILLVIVWILSLFTNSISLFIFELKESKSHVSCRPIYETAPMFFYQLYITMVFLFIPLTMMIALYGNVIYTLNTAIENQEINSKLIEKIPTDRSASITEWFMTAVRTNRLSETLDTIRSGKCSSRSSFMINSPSSPLTPLSDHTQMQSNTFLRSSNQERILIAKRKVTRMLITIVVLFAACWTPSYFWWLIVRFGDAMGLTIWDSGLNTTLTLLTYISSCTNPLTYCFMNKSFRRALLSYFRKTRKPKPVQIQRNSSPPAPTPHYSHPVPKIRIDYVSTTTN